MEFINVDPDECQVTVLALDSADAEIFAADNAAKEDNYFEDMAFGTAQDVSEFYEDKCKESGLRAYVLEITL